MGASDEYKRNQLETLGTAIISDVLDVLGHRTSFLGPGISAMWPSGPIAGRAITIGCTPTEMASLPDPDRDPYGVLFSALAEHQTIAVLVIAAGDQVSGVWGELLSVAACARGIVGLVTDGLTRDLTAIAQLGFPVYGSGTSPADSAGRQDFAITGDPVRFGDTLVRPGDWMVGDELGVVTVPVEHVDQVIELGLDKQRGESVVRAELAAGADLADVFRRHGIV